MKICCDVPCVLNNYVLNVKHNGTVNRIGKKSPKSPKSTDEKKNLSLVSPEEFRKTILYLI